MNGTQSTCSFRRDAQEMLSHGSRGTACSHQQHETRNGKAHEGALWDRSFHRFKVDHQSLRVKPPPHHLWREDFLKRRKGVPQYMQRKFRVVKMLSTTEARFVSSGHFCDKRCLRQLRLCSGVP